MGGGGQAEGAGVGDRGQAMGGRRWCRPRVRSGRKQEAPRTSSTAIHLRNTLTCCCFSWARSLGATRS